MDVYFQEHPDVIIGTTTFRNVPTILQYEDTQLLEVAKDADAGYETRFPVFHEDGTPLAVVRGARIIPTDEGRKANIKMRHLPDLTVCELEGKPILEMRRIGAAALKGWAELYAPEGVLVKANNEEASALYRNRDLIKVGPGWLSGSTFDGCKIGIHIQSHSIQLGTGGGSVYIGRLEF